MKSRWRELVQEFRTVFAGRGNLADAIVPPLLFVILQPLLGFAAAAWGSLVLALLLCAYRLVRGRPRYALGGLVSVLLALGAARLLDSAQGAVLPGVISGLLTTVVCAVSVAAGRPLVAWTSHVARRWPLGWYWHSRVRPAYNEVTLAWAVFFVLRWLPQLALVGRVQAQVLAVVQIAAGWPATLVLLAASYLYGTWRLRTLGGPSVQEFESGAEPPWEGQRRGF